MKGQKITKAEMDSYVTSAISDIKAKNPSFSFGAGSVWNVLNVESGGIGKGGVATDPGINPRPIKDDTHAAGVCQMTPGYVAGAHKYLTGKEVTGAELTKLWQEVTDDPKKSILYATGGYAAMEQRIRGWACLRDVGASDAAIHAVTAAAYHLGEGGAKPLAVAAATPPPFNLSKFVDLYEAKAANIGELNPRVRNEAGIGGKSSATNGSGSSNPNQRIETVWPTDADAEGNNTIPLSFDVSGSSPITPVQVIQEGLNLASWWETGNIVGNPHLRRIPTPSWFELRLNRTDGTSLSDKSGAPIQVRLNVSLQSVNVKSQHIVNREPTATGLMITFWGSQPDVLVGRGTTGAFVNQFGLAALMSNKLSAKTASWGKLIQDALKHNPGGLRALEGAGGTDVFRVAAQDAFAEMLMLFKNNGVTRFLPMPQWANDMVERSPTGTAALAQGMAVGTAYDDNASVFSPAAGATGYQMKARAGDVYTRGYVAFKYKGKTYLGYFKTLNFTASAASPFKWDFDFTFRVIKSFTPVFQPSEMIQ